ncbi:MAG: hypothetical protein ACFN26_02675, partial [Kingella denitrificans]
LKNKVFRIMGPVLLAYVGVALMVGLSGIGTYADSADELYLFNPATRQFQTPPDGQGFTGNVEVIRKGCIRVEYKISIRDYEEEDYCWKNGDWEMLRPQKHQRTQ